jgi:hypothetical protein
MFGCLRRIGCLAILLIVIAALWLTRDQWRERVFGKRVTAQTGEWVAVTPDEATRAQTAVQSLARSGGPAYRDLSPGELGALLTAAAGGTLPDAITKPEIAIRDDRVLLRAMIKLDDLKGVEDLGPLRKLLDREETFEASGTLGLVRPGLAEYRIESARVAEFDLPKAVIPRIVARISPTNRPVEVAENGIPFAVPDYIGDVRVARGRVTLYKKVQ